MYDFTHFTAPNGATIRAIHTDGQFWYLGADALKALGRAIAGIRTGELTGSLGTTHLKRVASDQMDAPGGGPPWRFITEAALLRMFSRSRKPDAERLATWVRQGVDSPADGGGGDSDNASNPTAVKLRRLADKLEQADKLQREVTELRRALERAEEDPRPTRERDERAEAFATLKNLPKCTR